MVAEQQLPYVLTVLQVGSNVVLYAQQCLYPAFLVGGGDRQVDFVGTLLTFGRGIAFQRYSSRAAATLADVEYQGTHAFEVVTVEELREFHGVILLIISTRF